MSKDDDTRATWPSEQALREFIAGKTRAAYDETRGSIGGPASSSMPRVYGKTFAEIRDGHYVWPSGHYVYANSKRPSTEPGAIPLFVKGTGAEPATVSLPKPPDGLAWNPAFVTGAQEKLHEILKKMTQAEYDRAFPKKK